MGAYLSEPVTDKVSSDEVGERVNCGASSMQGWRVTQEDAHNCAIEYDKNTSLFAVYDGHGGHEVAEYCAQKLPEFLKKCEAYEKGDFQQALKDAFLGFDATLASPEVVAILKQIAKNKNDDEPPTSGSEDEENVRNLYEEARMPLEQVMAKYQSDHLNPHLKKLKSEGNKPPGSPYLRAHRQFSPGTSGSRLSSKGAEGSNAESEVSSSSCPIGSPVKPDQSSDHEVSNSSTSNGDARTNSKNQASDDKVKQDAALPDSSGDVKVQGDSKSEVTNTDVIPTVKKQEMNGEVGADEVEGGDEVGKGDGEGVTSSSAPHENGDIAEEEGKGKGKAVSKSPKKMEQTTRMSLRPQAAAALYRSLLGGQDQSDSDTDDDGDELFQAVESSDEDEDCGAGEEGEGVKAEEEDEEDDEEEGDDEEEEEEEEDDDESVDLEDMAEADDMSSKMTEEPGSDSGCTAVVALLRGQELYVANSGDSRCVVCRKGQAVEMSLDHKPEDDLEMKRIVKAGGKVTCDGRVNGGLNLSRALGDHAYKQTESLPAEEQMITALPDIRTLMIDPLEDEFMVLACDGIWNFMSSQDVVDFVRPRIQEEDVKLSQICEELFDHCLAPNTLGDGTGCDNMTAVIVQFRSKLAAEESKSLKRSSSPIATDEDSTKRQKIEEPGKSATLV